MGQRKNNKAVLPWFLYRENNITEQDWIDTRNFLSNIGYDISKNIHEQFMKRHKRLDTDRDII